MGEKNRVAEAKEIEHDVVVDWVSRGILITLVRQGEGKGLAHGRLVKRTIAALEAGDDFEYLKDGTSNLIALPGEQRLAMPPVPGIIKEMITAGFIEDANGIANVTIMTRADRECPDRVVTLTTAQIEFLLKAADEKPLRNSMMESVVGALGDLEDAKAGRYQLPEELRVREPAALPAADAS